MKNLLIASSLSVALIASTSALAMPPKPAQCPSVSSLQSAKFELAEQTDDGTWVAGVIHSNFDLEDAWTFILGKINAENEQDAIDKAQASLSTLSFQGGPIAIEDYGLWGCGYYTAEGYPAAALTPALAYGLKASASLLK